MQFTANEYWKGIQHMNTTGTWRLLKRFTPVLGISLFVASACVTEDDVADGTFVDPGNESVGAVSQALTSAACADPSTATITGTAGDDMIYGTPGDDIIFGLGGDDVINGFGGNDILCGGTGQDRLIGGDGDDEIDGGPDFNWLRGDAGDDVIFGGDNGNESQGNAGDDTIYGGAGADTLYGGDDADVLRGGGGNDYMLGNAGDDKLFGGAGNDTLQGNAGDDCLDGDEGDDRLYGNDGDDCLDGGDGVDRVACGGDADTYENGEYDYSGCETAGVCECDAVVGGPCLNGATELSVSPSGLSKVCDDPTNATCEQDFATLCPAGWHLCSQPEHNNRNDGWNFAVSGGAASTVVGQISCRSFGGAGHLSLGPYDGIGNLGTDAPLN